MLFFIKKSVHLYMAPSPINNRLEPPIGEQEFLIPCYSIIPTNQTTNHERIVLLPTLLLDVYNIDACTVLT